MRRSARPLVAVLAAITLLLAGCSGDDAESSPEEAGPSAQKTQDGGVFASTWPLTGLEATGDERTAKHYPIFVVKIDNSSSSAPQVGLGDADLVVEELVEGGTTRLAAFFYSSIPDDVGPVRSMRASDIGIVPTKARIVTSGAAPVTIRRIRQAGFAFYSEGSPGFYRSSSRSAPYNLFTDLTEIADKAKTELARPDDYLPWGTAEDLPRGKPATTVFADFGNHTTQWDYDASTKGWTSPTSYAGADDTFPADTVLALSVQTGDAGYLDPSGAYVPETKLVGTGVVRMFHAGRMIRGKWRKEEASSPLELSTAKGPLTVPAGHVFIELVPRQGGGLRWEK